MQKSKRKPPLIFLFDQIWTWDKGMYLSMFLYTIFFSATPIIAIYVPKLLIDAIQSDGFQKIQIIIVSGFVLSAFCVFLTEYLRGNYRMRYNSVRYKMIERLNYTTMTMAFPLTEDADVLDQLSTISNYLLNPRIGPGGIMDKFLSIFGSLVGVIGFAAVIGTLNIWVLILLFLSIMLTYYLSLKASQYEEKHSDELYGSYRRHIYGSNTAADFTFAKDIRMYQLGSLLKAKMGEAAAQVNTIYRSIANRQFRFESLIAIIGLFRDVLIYGYITYRFLQGDLTAGNFFLYTSAATAVVIWLSDTLRDISFIQVQSSYVRKYQAFLEETDMSTDEGLQIDPDVAHFDIEFKNVCFKYPETERLVLEDLNLKLSTGERVALVGENGAGKTTIVKLLSRLYEPTSGQILLNGFDIQSYDYLDYQHLISTVLQDAKVFPFTIAENIALETEIDPERLDAAIRKSGFEPILRDLKDGVDTWLLRILNNDGVDLSGGQRQRLFLARALYQDRPIIILDEPTAALDPLAEYDMYQSFDKVIGNTSALYISHRLSSTRFCDRIVFLEDGKITEYGTHQELVQLGGSYARLFEIQAQYYRNHKPVDERWGNEEEF